MADAPRTRRTPPARRTTRDARTHASRIAVRRAALNQQPNASGVPGWLLTTCAVVAVLAAMILLVVATIRTPPTPVLRLSVPLVWALAAGLVFVPLERRLDVPGLGWQGVLGWTLLSYAVGFMPAPHGALLDLPELPSYLVLLLAVFYAVAAAAVPCTWFVARRRTLDDDLRIRRARRHAYAVALVVVVLMMAALRVLTWWAFALVVVVLILAEVLFVAQWEGTGNR